MTIIAVPEYIQLYPTVRCNQHCLFCFNDNLETLPDLTFGRALELLDILLSGGIHEMDIMGGEPFLIDWMPDFIREAAARGMSLSISTNGSCRAALDKLRGLTPERLTVGVSLEGSTAARHNRLTGAGNFLHAVESLKHLSALGLDPLAKTVLNRETADDVRHIIGLLRDLGIRKYFLIHMDLFSSAPELSSSSLSYPRFKTLFESFRDANPDMGIFSVAASCFDGTAAGSNRRCSGGSRKVSVLPDGSVFPCNLFHGFKEFRLGNLFDEGLMPVLTGRRLDYFRTFTGNCCPAEDCSNRGLCTGGCPAHSYYHSGSLDHPDIRCITEY